MIEKQDLGLLVEFKERLRQTRAMPSNNIMVVEMFQLMKNESAVIVSYDSPNGTIGGIFHPGQAWHHVLAILEVTQ